MSREDVLCEIVLRDPPCVVSPGDNVDLAVVRYEDGAVAIGDVLRDETGGITAIAVPAGSAERSLILMGEA